MYMVNNRPIPERIEEESISASDNQSILEDSTVIIENPLNNTTNEYKEPTNINLGICDQGEHNIREAINVDKDEATKEEEVKLKSIIKKVNSNESSDIEEVKHIIPSINTEQSIRSNKREKDKLTKEEDQDKKKAMISNLISSIWKHKDKKLAPIVNELALPLNKINSKALEKKLSKPELIKQIIAEDMIKGMLAGSTVNNTNETKFFLKSMALTRNKSTEFNKEEILTKSNNAIRNYLKNTMCSSNKNEPIDEKLLKNYNTLHPQTKTNL